MSRDEIKARSWDSADIVLVTGDAYVDHPSFGTAVIGRVLENAGFRVAVLSQPDWRSKKDFPLYVGIAFGLFGLSHLATLLGLKAALSTILIVIRTIAYLLVAFTLYKFAFSKR